MDRQSVDDLTPHRVCLPLVNTDVTPMSSEDLTVWIAQNCDSKKRHLIANHNLHSLYLMETDEKFRSAYELATLILIDGFPVLKLAQSGNPGKYGNIHRIGTMDWIFSAVIGSQIDRLAVVGGGSLSNREAVERLTNMNRNIEVRGWPGENWAYERESEIVGALTEFRPNLVLVGLGMPLQESFLLDCWMDLPPAIYATVGGAIDQISGAQLVAPRWLGRFGLEWAWRLLTQPRRLAFRYLIEPALLIHAVRLRRS